MKKIAPLFFITLVICSCKKEDPGKEPLNKPIVLTSFPMAAGHTWKYHTLRTAVLTADVSFSFYDTYWEVIKDTIITGIPCSKIVQQNFFHNSNPDDFKGHSYYANLESGFYKIARDRQVGPFSFKDEFQGPASPGEFTDVNVPTTSSFFTILDNQPLLMKFPSAIGDTWDGDEYPNSYVKRSWLGYETITTKAGTFDCIKMALMRDYDLDGLQDENSLLVYQYFSEKGLIREVVYDPTSASLDGTNAEVQTTDLVEVNF